MTDRLTLKATERAAMDADEAIDLAVMEEMAREPKRTDAQQRMYDRIKHEDPYGHEHRFTMGGR